MAEKYKNYLKIRITDLEKEQLLFLAETTGINLSELIRRKIRNIRVVAKSDFNLLNELRRQGGLLKHSLSIIQKSTLSIDEKLKIIKLQEETLLEMKLVIEKISVQFNSKDVSNNDT